MNALLLSAKVMKFEEIEKQNTAAKKERGKKKIFAPRFVG
jgi:hypothetical protein